MGKTGQFVHRIVKTVNQDFTNAYASDKNLEIRLIDDIVGEGTRSGNSLFRQGYFSGNIQLIRFKGTITSGSPTTITFKGYEDEAGTKLLLPPSASQLEIGFDGTSYGASFLVNCYHSSAADYLYLFLKTDSGVFNVDEVQVAWFE